MRDRPRYVIVGASLAGATAAAALRSEGFDGQIVLIGAEDRLPYERPPLSKEYLRGEAEDGSPYLDANGLFDDQAIELRTGAAAISLDTVDRSVTLAGGERVGYDALLLATGAEPRRPSIAGADLEGTHHLRTIDDADALRAGLRGRPRVVVVGGGWIGCEVAASAAHLGASVTLVELSAAPLIQALGASLGSFYADVHAEHGIHLRMNRSISHIEGAGRVERVVLADGERIDADLVVFGVGVAPRTALAEAAGLEVGNGILVDERLQTSVPGVFAAGDVANALNLRYGHRLRVEHWANARDQAAIAARGMLGKPAAFTAVPYFFSDQYDVGMEYRGAAAAEDELVVRGDIQGKEFIAFWLRGGRLRAAMNVNVWDCGDQIEALLGTTAEVDARRLADPTLPLDDLLAAELPAAAPNSPSS